MENWRERIFQRSCDLHVEDVDAVRHRGSRMHQLDVGKPSSRDLGDIFVHFSRRSRSQYSSKDSTVSSKDVQQISNCINKSLISANRQIIRT